MSEVLQAEARDLKFSRGELNQFRRNGKIPAVIFGKGIESVPVFVDLLAFQKAYKKSGKIFEVKIGNTTELVNTKNIDRSVFGKVHHINFQKLVKGQATIVNCPITLEGEAIGVKAGGMVQLISDSLEVEGKPKDIPESIHVDISALEVGGHITAGDIKLPSGLKLIDDAAKDIVTCSIPKQQAEEAPAAEAEASEAPAAGGNEGSEA